jgi:cell division septation protein DedD
MRTIAAFNHADQAHFLRSRLEGSGIGAHVRDEHMVSLDWLAALAVGGVKVDVADEDYEAALAMLAEDELGA